MQKLPLHFPSQQFRVRLHDRVFSNSDYTYAGALTCVGACIMAVAHLARHARERYPGEMIMKCPKGTRCQNEMK